MCFNLLHAFFLLLLEESYFSISSLCDFPKELPFFCRLSGRPSQLVQPECLLLFLTQLFFGVCVYVCYCDRLFAIPQTIAHQASLSMGFPREEYWSGLPFPPPGDLSESKIKPMTSGYPELQEDFLPAEPSGKSTELHNTCPTSTQCRMQDLGFFLFCMYFYVISGQALSRNGVRKKCDF